MLNFWLLALSKQHLIEQSNTNLVDNVHIRGQRQDNTHHDDCRGTDLSPTRETNILHLLPNFGKKS